MRTLAELEQDPEFNRHAWNDVDSGEYEKFYKPQPGELVLDIGAHHGLFTERASEWVGDSGWVTAIEPHPDNFRKLEKDLGWRKNCELIHGAVVNIGGPTVELWHNDGNSGGHSLYKTGGLHSRSITVPTVSLSFLWVLGKSDRHLRFVKIDAENSELEILKSLIPTAAPIDIAFEAHTLELYDGCMRLLAADGYEILTPEPKIGICHARTR